MRAVAFPLVACCLAIPCVGSCAGGDGTDGDGTADSTEILDAETEDAGADTPSGEDQVDAWDLDVPEALPDCFLGFDGGYDLAGLGLEAMPPDRPPTDCGECCRQVSFSDDMLTIPDALNVWDRYLVYSTTGTYCGDACWSRIVVVDLMEQVEYEMDEMLRESSPTDGTHEGLSEPAIHEENVYYTHSVFREIGDTREIECEIIRFSLLSGVRDVVYSFIVSPCETGCFCPNELDAFDNHLVWYDSRAGSGGRPYVLEIDSGVVTRISDLVTISTEIWGDRIAYLSGWGSLEWVEIYDIDTGTKEIVTDYAHDRWYPSIWESLLSWSDARAGGSQADQAYSDIYLMHLGDWVEMPVCTHPASQFGSHVFGDLIVWSDLRNDPLYPNNYVAATNHDVFGFRISTGEEFQITDLPGEEWAMRLHDNHVFFLMDDESGVQSIFMKDIPRP